MQYRTILLLEWTLLVSLSSSGPLGSSRNRKSTRKYISPVTSTPSLTPIIPNIDRDTLRDQISTDLISNSHFKESIQHINDSVLFPDSSVNNRIYSSAHKLPDSNPVMLGVDTVSLDSSLVQRSSHLSHKASIISSSLVEWKPTRQTSIKSTDTLNHLDANIKRTQYNAGYLIAPSSTLILDTVYSHKTILNEIPHIPLNVKSTIGISEKWDADFSLSDINNRLSKHTTSSVVKSLPVSESTTISLQSTGIGRNSIITNDKMFTSSQILGASDSTSQTVDTQSSEGENNDSTLENVVTSTELNKDKSEHVPETSSIVYDKVLIEPSTSPILSTRQQTKTAILDDNSSVIRTKNSSPSNQHLLMSPTSRTIRPTPHIQQPLLSSSNLYRHINEAIDSLNKLDTSTSKTRLTIQPTPQSASELLPTDTHSSVSLTDDFMLENVVFPDLPSASEIIKNASSDNDNQVSHPTPLLPNETEHTCSFDNFLHRFLMAEKRLKSSRTGSKLLASALNPPNTQRTTGSSSSTSPTGTQNSGVVCYDDRTTVSLPDVDCPKATSRKTSLENSHLQQLLKNEGGTLLRSDVVTDSDVEEVIIDKVNKGNDKKTLIFQIQQLLDEEVTFYKSLRQIIKDFLTSSTNRDIVSLTHFLTDTAEKVFQESNSKSRTSEGNSYDIDIICELFELDIISFRSLQSEIENEMLKTQIIFISDSNFEDTYENVQFYNHQSRRLLKLHNKLLSSLSQWNTTFRNVLPEILSWTSQSKASSRLKQFDRDANATSVLENSNKSTFTSHDSIVNEKPRSKKTQECINLKESNTKTKQVGDNAGLKSDTQSGDSSLRGSWGIFERYATIIAELCHLISSKLADSKFPRNTKNMTLEVLHDLSNQSTTLMEQFIKQNENKRTKRSVGGYSPETCFQQGSRVPQTDFLYMCATCVQTTVLDTSYFPRHLTEKVCKNSGSSSVSQSGSVGIQNGCLNEGGRPGGLCRQQTMTVLLLRQIPGRCMKIVNRGQDFITDQWKLVTYRLRVGCECVVDKNSQFAQYVKFG